MSILLMPVILQKLNTPSYSRSKKVDWPRYDGAATFAGKISGVHKRIQTASAYAICIHCSCYRLQLTLILAAASVKEIRILFLEP